MVKPVSLSNEAYGVLSKMKSEGESFSDVVLRLAEKNDKKTDLSRFFGVLSKDEADEMKKNIAEHRKNFKFRAVKF
jgi:predicted CopG family antitoxin